MKLVWNTDRDVKVELSESNLRALLADFDANNFTDLTRHRDGVTIVVSVRADDIHYSHDELIERGPNWKGASNA
jgi:hypothetical protein